MTYGLNAAQNIQLRNKLDVVAMRDQEEISIQKTRQQIAFITTDAMKSTLEALAVEQGAAKKAGNQAIMDSALC